MGVYWNLRFYKQLKCLKAIYSLQPKKTYGAQVQVLLSTN